MDVSLENMKGAADFKWAQFAQKQTLGTAEKAVELMNNESFSAAASGNAPMVKLPLSHRV